MAHLAETALRLPLVKSMPVGGITGRPIDLAIGDAGQDPQEVVKNALKIRKEQGVEAFVGIHNSALQVARIKAFAGTVPYVSTTIMGVANAQRELIF
jgi:ABC-type branched-subunit amino acid transport system substrate-binding protein